MLFNNIAWFRDLPRVSLHNKSGDIFDFYFPSEWQLKHHFFRNSFVDEKYSILRIYGLYYNVVSKLLRNNKTNSTGA